MNSLGQRIAYYRKRAGLTQEQLAEKCSVTSQAVSKWENDLSAPDIGLIAPLAELFSITCDDLLGVQRSETGMVAPELLDFNRTILKVRVNSNDGDVVNVNLPVNVANIFIKSGMIKNVESIDFEQVIKLAKSGVVGKLLDVKSSDGDTVEVWVE